MSVREHDDPKFFAKIHAQNLLRQYDLLANCIEIGLAKGIEAFDKYTLWSLNAAAVANIAQFGGRFRRQPVYVDNHIPPHFKEVPEHVDEFLSVVHENWDGSAFTRNPMLMPAYALWRLNWIHPFVEGNGRTARAACYYLICFQHGELIGGGRTIPERIRDDPSPYYAALKDADRHWEAGDFNVDALAGYLEDLLIKQLSDT